MTTPRIYSSQPLILEQELLLSPTASAHILRVLRMQQGDSLLLFDGQGQEFRAKLLGQERKLARVYLEETLVNGKESPLFIHLGQAISRGERMDYTLQKSTELGVSKITPLWTDYVNVRLDSARLTQRMEHWHGVIISACEQCGRASIPELAEPQSLTDWVKNRIENQKIILEPTAEMRFSQLQPTNSAALVIGPEGGFNEKEVSLAQQENFQSLRFGPRILRTETAAPAVIAVMQCFWGDMG